jgi:hypothetical protein
MDSPTTQRKVPGVIQAMATRTIVDVEVENHRPQQGEGAIIDGEVSSQSRSRQETEAPSVVRSERPGHEAIGQAAEEDSPASQPAHTEIKRDAASASETGVEHGQLLRDQPDPPQLSREEYIEQHKPKP